MNMRLKPRAYIFLILKIIISRFVRAKFIMAIEINMTPSHPGSVIQNWILPEGMSITEAAKRLGVSRQSLDALVNGRRSVSPEMAKRIELAFGGSAELLLNLQMKFELAQIEARVSELAEEVEPYQPNS